MPFIAVSSFRFRPVPGYRSRKAVVLSELQGRVDPTVIATCFDRLVRTGDGEVRDGVTSQETSDSARRHIPPRGARVSVDDRDMFRLLTKVSDSGSMQHTAQEIVEFAAHTFGTGHAGITLISDGGRRFKAVGPSDEAVRQADELQDQLKEGPCVDAAVESRSVMSNDLAGDPRWPRWGPGIAGLGLGSVLSSELHAGDRRIGALNVYGDRFREFSREDVELGHVLAEHAAVALRYADQVEGLQTALDSRTVIGQAQGVLMERYTIDADRAFAILRRYSQERNTRLVEVARALIAATV